MNNTTDDSLPEFNYTRYTLNIILIWASRLTWVTTIVINTVTVIVMVTTPKLRTRTNSMIISLAVSDIIFSLYTFILNAIPKKMLPNNYSHEFITFWRASVFAWNIQIHGCYGNLLLIALERWLFIAKPFWYQRFVTTRVVLASIATIWASSFLFNFPYLCTEYSSSWLYESLISAYINPAVHTALFFILLAIYTHICLITLSHLKKLSKASQRNSQQTVQNGERAVAGERFSLNVRNLKSIKLLISICGIFFLLVSPHIYYEAYTTIIQQDPPIPDVIVYNTSLLLFNLFHCTNCFVYALGIPLFRKTLRKQCCRLMCCKGSHFRQEGSSRWDSMRGCRFKNKSCLI